MRAIKILYVAARAIAAPRRIISVNRASDEKAGNYYDSVGARIRMRVKLNVPDVPSYLVVEARSRGTTDFSLGPRDAHASPTGETMVPHVFGPWKGNAMRSRARAVTGFLAAVVVRWGGEGGERRGWKRSPIDRRIER